MTDFLHIAELLHKQQATTRSSLVGLTSWLERRRLEGHDDTEAAELRLETDEEAVQVVTVHKSKGLQYGVVFAPFLWKDEGGRSHPPVVTADPNDPTQRRLVLSASGPLAEAATERADLDSRQEGVRLLYVALTRARHRCVVYWPGMMGSRDRRVHAPLAAVLHGTHPSDPHASSDRILSAVQRLADDGLEAPDAQLAELRDLARTSALDGVPTVGVQVLAAPDSRIWSPPKEPLERLKARQLDRAVDDGWRRHSYSAITRSDLSRQADDQVDPARALGFDDDGLQGSEHSRPHLSAPSPVSNLAERADVPLAGLPAGADAGTCLHAIFEHVDFRSAHPESLDADALRAVATRQLEQHGFRDEKHADLVVEHFPAVFQTPLAPLLPGHRLCDIHLDDRLDELRFDFPIAGGDAHGRTQEKFSRVTSRALHRALSTRGDHDVVPLEWLDRVAHLGFAPLAGMMTGSIDLVFRVRETAADIGRWFVVDYKSNRLDPHQTGRTPAEHFHFAGMQYEMAHHHYFLQYHIYSLALHRYLRMRLGDRYDYRQHFGGVMYLFFRGMTGPDAEDPTQPGGVPGVFTDRPPAEVLSALDSLFDGRGGAA